jgi:hypothetical protein
MGKVPENQDPVIVLGVQALEGKRDLPTGANTLVVGFGPRHIEELIMSGGPFWIETPQGVPDIMFFYGRDPQAAREVICECLGLRSLADVPPPRAA